MILGGGLALAAKKANMGFSAGLAGVILFPLVSRAFGILASMVGILSVRLKTEAQDPMHALNRGYFITIAIVIPLFGLACKWLLDSPVPQTPGGISFYADCGILTSVAFVYITQYYTESRYRPVQSIAEHALQVLLLASSQVLLWVLNAPGSGFAYLFCLLDSYMGSSSGLEHAGLFGTAVATMGMLSTAAFILAMETFCLIADNAGGKHPDE